MQKFVITEEERNRIRGLYEQISGNTNQSSTKCPDPNNIDSYPNARKVKAQQGLFNALKLKNKKGQVINLNVDGRFGPKTSEALGIYITSKGMTPMIASEEWGGPHYGGLVDDTFGGDDDKADQLYNYIPPVPPGCKKYRFDK
jgi:hypothetical protein